MSAKGQIDTLERLMATALDPEFFEVERLSLRSALVAARVLGALGQLATRPPFLFAAIIPTPEGGISLEWETLEVEILPSGDWEGLFSVDDKDYEAGGRGFDNLHEIIRLFLEKSELPPFAHLAGVYECAHEWVEVESDRSELFADVQCSRCGVSGQRTEATGEVYWPAT